METKTDPKYIVPVFIGVIFLLSAFVIYFFSPVINTLLMMAN